MMRPFADWLLRRLPIRGQELPPNLMAIVICLMFVLALCTFELGIFAIFGGFAAGLLFHRDQNFVAAWRRQVGQFVVVFFLPVFFTSTGLRTNILGLSSPTDLLWLGIILVVSVLGKIIPVYIAGRLTGFSHDRVMYSGLTDEHARVDGTDRSQYRLRPRIHSAIDVYHTGGHGGGHHDHDRAAFAGFSAAHPSCHSRGKRSLTSNPKHWT